MTKTSINHAERVKAEDGRDDGLMGFGDGATLLDTLMELAAGSREVDAALDAVAEKIEALAPGSIKKDAIGDCLSGLRDPLRENGFNAGFEYGFTQGAMLSLYGHKKA